MIDQEGGECKRVGESARECVFNGVILCIVTLKGEITIHTCTILIYEGNVCAEGVIKCMHDV